MDDKLKELYEIMFDDVLSKKDAKEFLQLVFALSAKSKKEIDQMTAETKQDIENTIEYFKTEKENLEKELTQHIKEKKDDVDNQIRFVDDTLKLKIDTLDKLIEKVKAIKAEKGKDGENGKNGKDGEDAVVDYEYVIEETLKKIPEKEEMTAELIVDEINKLPTNKDTHKIDASHIKNLPKQPIYTGGGGGVRLLSLLNDVNTSGVADGQVLTYESATATWIPSTPVSRVEFTSGIIETPADGTYKVIVNIPYGITITETTTVAVSGTCTVNFQIDTTNLGGTANSVSSVETTQTHSSLNVADAGKDIQIKVSSNSACSRMSFTIKYTRN